MILATVDQRNITLEEFAEHYPELVSWFGIGAQAPQVQAVLEEMIFNQLLAREARQSALAERPDIQAQIDHILATAYLKSHMPQEKLTVDDAEAQRYYETHRENFLLPPQIQLSHILVESEDAARSVQHALEAGQPFAKLAAERSQDPASAQQGGKLGWVRSDHLMPQLAETALVLQPGQKSGVVKTVFGYHLVLLEDKRPAAFQPFDTVKNELYQQVRRQKQDAVLHAIKDGLWQRHRVVVYRENLQAAVQDLEENATIQADLITHHGTLSLHPSRPVSQLQVLSTVYDLGAIPAKTLTHTSLVTNSGTADLVIKNVRTTCRCATAVVTPTVLAPGQIGQLAFTFDPNVLHETGPSSKTIIIESNDPSAPRKMLYITMNVAREGRARDGS